MLPFYHPEADAFFGELEQRRSALHQLSSVFTAGQAQNVVAMMRRYPGARPGVQLALGLAGFDPESDVVGEIANMSLRDWLARNPTETIPVGSRVNGADLAARLREADEQREPSPEGPSFAELPWYRKIGRAVSNTFGAGGRILDTVLEGVAQEAGNIITSLAEAAFDDEPGFLDDAFENFTQRRTSYLRQAFGEFGDRLSDGFQPSDVWRDWDELTGSGFFVGQDSVWGQEQERFERMLHIPGRPDLHYTPGRALIQPLVELGAIEPGTRAYHTVSGLADIANRIFLDPANLVLPGSAARKAVDDIDDFLPMVRDLNNSLLRGPRRTVHVNGIEHHLSGGSRAGRRMVEKLSEMTAAVTGDSAEVAAARLLRLSNHKMPVDVANRIARSESPEEIIEVLRETLQDPMMARFRVPVFAQARLRMKDVRAFNGVPQGGTPVTYHDLDVAAREVDRWLANAKVTGAKRDELVGRVMAFNPDEPDALGRWNQQMIEVTEAGVHSLIENTTREGRLLQRGLSEDRAQELARAFSEHARSDLANWRRYAYDQLGNELPGPGTPLRVTYDDGRVEIIRLESGEIPVIAGAKVEVLPTPRDINMLMREGVRLPDYKRIRTALSRINRITDSVPMSVYRDILQPLWVTSTIGRPALAVRVIAENQARMAAWGVDSAFRHPISWISYMLGRKGGLAPVGDGAWDDIEDSLHVMSSWYTLKESSGRVTPGAILTNDYATYTWDSEAFPRVWAMRLAHMHRTPDIRYLAQHGKDETVDWLLGKGELGEQGARIRQRLNDVYGGRLETPEQVREHVETQWQMLHAATGGRLREITEDTAGRVAQFAERGDLPPVTGVRRYVVEKEGNPDLLALVAEGRLGKVDLGKRHRTTVPDLAAVLPRYRDTAPQTIAGPRMVGARHGTIGAETLERMNATLDALFDSILSKWEDMMSRSPTFRQLTWKEVERLSVYADDQVRATLARRAREAGLKDVAKRIQALPSTTDIRYASADDLGYVAAAWAAEEMKDLLYDFANRGQIMDMLRTVMPFGEAWLDVIRTWARIGRKGTIVRRGQVVIRGARESNPLDLLPGGDGDPSDDGFFYLDQNGQEMFAYPDWLIGGALIGSGSLIGGGVGAAVGGAQIGGRIGSALGRVAGPAGALAGGLAGGYLASQLGVADQEQAQVTFEGSVQGLNLVTGQILPGFGPVVQFPAGALLRDAPSDSFLRQLLIPYGSPGLVESAMPAWMRRLQQALSTPESNRQFGNTVHRVMQMLLASGEYTTDSGLLTGEEAQRLYEDAVRQARALTVVQAAAQTTLPTGPQLEFEAVWEDGDRRRTISFVTIANEYRKLMNEVGEDQAFSAFVDLFGSDLVGLLINMSRSVRERSVDVAGAAWERRHPELVQRYRNVIGFFAPEGGGFDFDAYEQQLREGDRRDLSPTEAQHLYNDLVGHAIYEAQKRRLGPAQDTDTGRIYLSELRAAMRVAYPGFDSVEYLQLDMDTDSQIAQIEDAVDDPQLEDLPVSRAAREYLRARQQVLQTLAANNLTAAALRTSTSDVAQQARAELREVGMQIARRTPEFAGMWRMVFSRELRNDIEATEVSAPTLPLARTGRRGLATFGGVVIGN